MARPIIVLFPNTCKQYHVHVNYFYGTGLFNASVQQILKGMFTYKIEEAAYDML